MQPSRGLAHTKREKERNREKCAELDAAVRQIEVCVCVCWGGGKAKCGWVWTLLSGDFMYTRGGEGVSEVKLSADLNTLWMDAVCSNEIGRLMYEGMDLNIYIHGYIYIYIYIYVCVYINT